MRYPASEKLEIIGLVEGSHLPAHRTLDKLGIPATTFYRWYDRYLAFGEAGLADRTSDPGRVWNRIPDRIRRQIVDLALDQPELSPRELAVTFTDTKGYFISEASVYRLLKAHDLITSPAFVVIKAADVFKDRTTAPNQVGQTDFTYPKVISWGWFYLSTILDDHSRYIIAWKLCTTMRADDVTRTLNLALQASGCGRAAGFLAPTLRTAAACPCRPILCFRRSCACRRAYFPPRPPALLPAATAIRRCLRCSCRAAWVPCPWADPPHRGQLS